tara:strand:+ start:553 stop:861 length:309 start_codon:yes stop_codon:yes gene_type:complete
MEIEIKNESASIQKLPGPGSNFTTSICEATVTVVFCEGTTIHKTDRTDYWCIDSCSRAWLKENHLSCFIIDSPFVKIDGLTDYLSIAEKEEFIFNLDIILKL